MNPKGERDQLDPDVIEKIHAMEEYQLTMSVLRKLAEEGSQDAVDTIERINKLIPPPKDEQN